MSAALAEPAQDRKSSPAGLPARRRSW